MRMGNRRCQECGHELVVRIIEDNELHCPVCNVYSTVVTRSGGRIMILGGPLSQVRVGGSIDNQKSHRK
jgi:ribosomal protein S27E